MVGLLQILQLDFDRIKILLGLAKRIRQRRCVLLQSFIPQLQLLVFLGNRVILPAQLLELIIQLPNGTHLPI